jgi:hypothetical protein
MKQASTAWRDDVSADEARHMERVAEVITRLQQAKSKRFGQGRTFHRKPLLALEGTLEVLPDLPPHACHGLFATPGKHRALVRLSNGGPDVQANIAPDFRGFAVKVLDVQGEGAMGGTIDRQDFLMINHDWLPFRGSRDFIDLAEAATGGQAAIVMHFIRKHGWFAGWWRLWAVVGAMARKFGGFATDRFNTVVSHACGPYAVKVRLFPSGNPPRRPWGKDIGQDVRERLAKGPLAWDLVLQFYVDDATTPLNDGTKQWPDGETPMVTVARLTVPKQTGEERREEIERLKFDPWGGLAAHKPLGEVMRARKVAYFASQKGRGAL